MTDSAIAVATFGSGKAVLATDFSAGAHSPKVTTNAASDGIAISGFGGGRYCGHAESLCGGIEGMATVRCTVMTAQQVSAVAGWGEDK